MNSERVFSIDLFDPFVAEDLREILKRSKIISVTFLEQTIYQYNIRVIRDVEDVMKRISSIEYIPLHLKRRPDENLRKFMEDFFSTKISYIRELDNSVFCPINQNGFMIYRTPSEIFTFLQTASLS
jgi:hypothetical protein